MAMENVYLDADAKLDVGMGLRVFVTTTITEASPHSAHAMLAASIA